MSFNKETNMYEGYIYKITNDVNDKIYIGQTITTIKERLAQHKSSGTLGNSHLVISRAINKYGFRAFHMQEIEKHSCNTLEDLHKKLDKREIYFISEYNTKVPNGYNVSDGGRGVSGFNCRKIIVCDPYTKKQEMYNSIDDVSVKFDIPTSNIIMCCQRTKISAKNKLFKYYDNGVISQFDIDYYFSKHPFISQYDLLKNKLNVFYSTEEAAKHIKETEKLEKSIHTIIKNIGACCRGSVQTAYGFVWRRNNDAFDLYDLKINYPRNIDKYIEQEVDIYDFDGNLLYEFDNVKEAFSILGLEGKQLNQAIRCCNGQNTTAFGYIWRYHNDNFNKYSCATINGVMRVNKYTTDGIFIERFNSYKDAAQSVGTTNRKAISDCCNYIKSTYKNYMWFNVNDKNQPDKSKIIV